tara:strand:+ start:4073 stop:4216 length:144 start_codon:yes stop_codon:yes gene_type:complete
MKAPRKSASALRRSIDNSINDMPRANIAFPGAGGAAIGSFIAVPENL